MSLSGSNFYIAALPRSRTAWLSNLFCGRQSFCFHEALARFGSLPDRPEKYVGSAETCVDLIPKGARVLLIHRSAEECLESVRNSFTLPPNIDLDEGLFQAKIEKDFRRIEKELHQMEGFHIDFYDIDDRLDEIWKYLLPSAPVDHDRINEQTRQHIQLFETDIMEIK